jgi:hypothetical protein
LNRVRLKEAIAVAAILASGALPTDGPLKRSLFYCLFFAAWVAIIVLARAEYRLFWQILRERREDRAELN